MDQPPPLPKRIVWFAPWTWGRRWAPWKRWTVIALIALAGYIESVVPAWILAEYGLMPRALVYRTHYPVLNACVQSEIVDRFVSAQIMSVIRVLEGNLQPAMLDSEDADALEAEGTMQP